MADAKHPDGHSNGHSHGAPAAAAAVVPTADGHAHPTSGAVLSKKPTVIRMLEESETDHHRDFVPILDGKVVDSPHSDAYQQQLEHAGFNGADVGGGGEQVGGAGKAGGKSAGAPKDQKGGAADDGDDEVSFAVEEGGPQKLFAGKGEHKPALLSFGKAAFVGKNGSDKEDKRNEREQKREQDLSAMMSRDKLLNAQERDQWLADGVQLTLAQGKAWTGADLTQHASNPLPSPVPPKEHLTAAANGTPVRAPAAAAAAAGTTPPTGSPAPALDQKEGAAAAAVGAANIPVPVPAQVLAELNVQHYDNPLGEKVFTDAVRALFLDAANRIQKRADSVVPGGAAPAVGRLDSVDFHAPAQLQWLCDAFQVDEATCNDKATPYRKSIEANLRALKHVLRLHLHKMAAHPYYNALAFTPQPGVHPPAAEGEPTAGPACDLWLRTETQTLNDALEQVNARILRFEKPSAKPAAAKPKPAPAPVPGTSMLPPAGSGPKPRKYKGFPCCCVEEEEDYSAPAPAPVVPAPKPDQPPAAAAAATAAPAKQPEPQHDRKASELIPANGVVAGAEPDMTTNFHAHYRVLLNVLYQWDSKYAAEQAAKAAGANDAKDPALAAAAKAAAAAANPDGKFPVYSVGANVNRALRPLSDMSSRILKAYGQLYRVPATYRALCSLEVLCKNASHSLNYLALVHNAIARVQKLQKKPKIYAHWWVCAERAQWIALTSSVVQWTSRCLSRYQLVFHKKHADAAECVVLLKRAWGAWTAATPASHAPPPRAASVAKHLEGLIGFAVDGHYQLIVRVSAQAVEGMRKAELARGGSQSSLAEPSPHRLVGHIGDCAQLSAVLKSVTEEIAVDTDVGDQRDFPELGTDGWSWARTAADRYWGLSWPDATLFLRKLQSEDDTQIAEQELNRVFTVLTGMKSLYTSLARVMPLPDVQLQDLFRPFIDIWLVRTRKKFSDHYLVELTSNDPYERLGQNTDQFSTSVVDLFSLLYPLCRLFRRMPFTQKHVKEFAQLLTSIVLGYVKILGAACDKLLSAEAAKAENWGYAVDARTQKLTLSLPTPLLIRLNNIWVSRQMLSTLLETAKLEAAYVEAGSAQKLTPADAAVGASKDAAATSHTAKRRSSSIDEDDLHLPDDVANQLGCTEGFKSIGDTVELVAFRIARGIYPFCEKQLVELVFGKKFKADALFDEQKVHALLEPMWDYLYKHFANFAAQLFDAYVHKIIYFLMERICGCLERMIAWGANREEHTSLPRKEQLTRISFAFNLCLYFFTKIFGWQKLYEKKLGDGAMGSFKFLLELVRGPAPKMIDEWNKFPAATAAQEELLEKAGADIQEKARTKGRPWISRKQLAWYIVLRKERDDDSSKEVKEFCSKNTPKKKGFFAQLFS